MTTVDDRCRLFFRLFFDEFEFFDFSEKGYWARRFGKFLREALEHYLTDFDFSEDGCTQTPFGKKTGLMFSIFPKKCIGPGVSENSRGKLWDIL